MRCAWVDKMNKDEVPLKLNIKGGVPMDVTEKYILLCKEATEIQKLLSQAVRLYGTPFWHENVVIRIFAGEAFYFAGFNEAKKETIWLPTQNQLQRMLKSSKPEYFIGDFFYFVYDEKEKKNKEIVSKMETMEQLWLAYIMYTKYQKRWNDERKEWR